MLSSFILLFNCSRGQLGHGELENEEHPRELDALSGLKVVAISAGGWHSCCVTVQGDLYTWGWNCCGQLGFPGIYDNSFKVFLDNLMQKKCRPF